MRKFFLLAAALLGSAAANAQIIYEGTIPAVDSTFSENVYMENRQVVLAYGADPYDGDIENVKCLIIKEDATIKELLANGINIILRPMAEDKYDTFSLIELYPNGKDNQLKRRSYTCEPGIESYTSQIVMDDDTTYPIADYWPNEYIANTLMTINNYPIQSVFPANKL